MIGIAKNDLLANRHWENVKANLIARIKKVIKSKEIVFDKNDVALSDSLKGFLNELLENNNLEKLIKTESDQLPTLIEEYETLRGNFINRKKTNEMDDDYRILYNIFVNHGYKKLDNLNFIKQLQLDTCVYCNRSYTFHLDEKGEPKPEIDHFYPKDIYPFLAVSYYNLIPSCQTCNGYGGKHSTDTYLENTKNPYQINNDDFLFSYEITSLDFMNPISKKGAVKIVLPKKINSNADLFKLEKLYQKHEDHVLELIVKSKLDYTEKYRDYLKSYEGLNFSNAEIDRMIIGNYTSLDELHKRPLSKLYRDIALELGLIIE